MSFEDLSLLAVADSSENELSFPSSSEKPNAHAETAITACMNPEEAISDKVSEDSRIRMCGAAKKRYRRLLVQGGAPGRETKLLALRPLAEPSAPSGTVASKRIRSEEATPPAQSIKRSKRGEGESTVASGSAVRSGITFGQTAQSKIIGILPAEFPETILSVEQLKAVQDGILELVLCKKKRS